MSDVPNRRNPLRLIVSKETQLHILWLVAAGVFLCMGGLVAIICWIGDPVWATALGVALGLFVSLAVSRKIAGPFYRIEKDLEAILVDGAEGRDIRLRPNDPLQHLASLLNQLLERAGRRGN